MGFETAAAVGASGAAKGAGAAAVGSSLGGGLAAASAVDLGLAAGFGAGAFGAAGLTAAEIGSGLGVFEAAPLAESAGFHEAALQSAGLDPVTAGEVVQPWTTNPAVSGLEGAAAPSGLVDTAWQGVKDIYGNPIGKEVINQGVKATISSLANGNSSGGSSSNSFGGLPGSFDAQLSQLLRANNSSFGAATAAPLTPAVASLSGSHGPADPAGIIASMSKAAPSVTPTTGTMVESGASGVPAPARQTGAIRFGTTPLMHY